MQSRYVLLVPEYRSDEPRDIETRLNEMEVEMELRLI